MAEKQGTAGPSGGNTAINARWLDVQADRPVRLDIYPGEDRVYLDVDGEGVLSLDVDGGLDAALQLIGAICRLKRAAPAP
jgi:hypothetical protein